MITILGIRVACVCSLSAVAALGQGWTPHQGIPPASVGHIEGGYDAVLRFESAGIEGNVRVATEDKIIEVLWVHISGTTLRQQWSTAYWPTTASAVAGRKSLVVAGKRRSGNTVIERWDIQKPTYVGTISEPGSGSTGTPFLLPATITTTTDLYDEASQGRDMVHRLFLKIGDAHRMLVQFYDSSDLYEFDMGNNPASYQRIASPGGGPGVLTIPGLTDAFTWAWVGDHMNRGYLYVFSSDVGGVRPLVLLDANRDGVIEGFTRPTESEWLGEDWWDGTKYTYP